MLEIAAFFTGRYVNDFYGILIHTLNFLSGKAGAS
jgi:hypothetical protein